MKANIQFKVANLATLNIHYAFTGKPDEKSPTSKPLLICLHGFPEFWRTWQHQLEHLCDDYYVVAPDLRGYNLSEKPLGNAHYQITDLMQDVLELAQHLGYDTFNLVGHDWGGIVAWTLATLHPEVLHKLTIINSPHPRVFQTLLGYNQAQIAASSYINKFLDASAEEKLTRNDYDLLWRFGFTDLVEKKVFTQEDFTAHRAAWSQPGAVSAMLASYRAAQFSVPDAETRLPIEYDVSNILANSISIPTQVIWGMNDTALTAECLKGLDYYVPNLIVHKVPEAGHGIIHEKPDLINQHLRTFFRA